LLERGIRPIFCAAPIPPWPVCDHQPDQGDGQLAASRRMLRASTS